MRRAVMRVINMYTKCLEIWGESLVGTEEHRHDLRIFIGVISHSDLFEARHMIHGRGLIASKRCCIRS